MVETGRLREARIIARANRVEAVICLWGGKVDTWESFLRGTDPTEIARLNRSQLRWQAMTAKQRLRELIAGGNSFFFEDATEEVFDDLFEAIKSGIPLGLRMPVSDFEARFAPLRRETSKGRDQERPFHAAISMTLLGLRYEYPEWHFANDLIMATTEARELTQALTPFYDADKPDARLKREWKQKEELAKRHAAVCRWAIITCSSLLEAHLAALAWRFQRLHGGSLKQLSSKDRRTLDDAGSGFRDRLIRIPRILTGAELWDDRDEDVQAVMQLKRLRDALMHPSPWSDPEKYGGVDKLAIVYDLCLDDVERSVTATFRALKRVFQHLHGCSVPLPSWLRSVGDLVDGVMEPGYSSSGRQVTSGGREKG